MSSRGRGIRTHKVEVPKPRRQSSETCETQQLKAEKLLAKIMLGQILPDEAKMFNEILKAISTGSGEQANSDFLSSTIKSVRSSLMTESFLPLVRLYLIELIELAARGWNREHSSCYYYREKAEAMLCKQKATRIIKHSLSCPSQQTDTRRPLKQDGPAPDTFSDSVHRLCNDHRYMDSNINKIMIEAISPKVAVTRKIQHSVSCPEDQTDVMLRRPLKLTAPPLDTFSDSVHRTCDKVPHTDSNMNNIKIETMSSSDNKPIIEKKMQHLDSYPKEQAEMTRTSLKQNTPLLDTFSDSVHRLCKKDPHIDRNMNNVRAESLSPVSMQPEIRKVRHSISFPGEQSGMPGRPLKQRTPPLYPTFGSVPGLCDESRCTDKNMINLKECSVYIRGHVLRLSCDSDSDSLIQEAAEVLLSHFSDERENSSMSDALSPSINSQIGAVGSHPTASSPALNSSFQTSSLTDLELSSTTGTSRCVDNCDPDLHVQTLHSISNCDTSESLYSEEPNNEEMERRARRPSSVQSEDSGSVSPSTRQVIQYGKKFLLACATSPIATEPPEHWLQISDPTSYFDPSLYKSPTVLCPVMRESCAARTPRIQRTSLASDFYLMDSPRS